MNFSVKTNTLLNYISKIIGIIPSRSTIPELENFLFSLSENNLTITGTDTEVTIISKLNVVGEKDGEILVPAKKLFDTLKNQSEKTLNFVLEDGKTKVKISTETGVFHPGGISAENFIELPILKDEEKFYLKGESLKDLINTTSFAVSADDLRPAMMGVYFKIEGKKITAVSTDGHRLVKKTISVESNDEKEFIIPAKALLQIEKHINNEKEEIEIKLNKEYISFKVGESEIISRLICEKYPNYSAVIPTDNNTKLKTVKDELTRAVKSVSLYSNSISHQTKFNVKKNKIKISAEDTDLGQDASENINCEYSGEEFEVGFNANYILEALTHIKNENIVFRFSAPSKAVILVPAEQNKNEDVLMLVMPVRLS